MKWLIATVEAMAIGAAVPDTAAVKHLSTLRTRERPLRRVAFPTRIDAENIHRLAFVVHFVANESRHGVRMTTLAIGRPVRNVIELRVRLPDDRDVGRRHALLCRRVLEGVAFHTGVVDDALLLIGHPANQRLLCLLDLLVDGLLGSAYTLAREVNGRLVMVYSKDGLNDVSNAKGCCCCGGNMIVEAVLVNVNVFTYALLY